MACSWPRMASSISARRSVANGQCQCAASKSMRSRGTTVALLMSRAERLDLTVDEVPDDHDGDRQQGRSGGQCHDLAIIAPLRAQPPACGRLEIAEHAD